MAETVVVNDPEAARAFGEIPRTEGGRVSLRVGNDRFSLNRWGTLLASSLVVGSPRRGRALRVLRIRRMKRPKAASAASTGAAVSTAVIAQPLGSSGSTDAPATAKPDRATRRARRRVKRYASGRIWVASDADEARAFLERALATSEPVVVRYGDTDVTMTPDGSRAILSLFATSRVRLAFVHLLLEADRFRPQGKAKAKSATAASETAQAAAAASGKTPTSDPSDPWGPFSGDFPISLGT
jgi:hypothetical protein